MLVRTGLTALDFKNSITSFPIGICIAPNAQTHSVSSPFQTPIRISAVKQSRSAWNEGQVLKLRHQRLVKRIRLGWGPRQGASPHKQNLLETTGGVAGTS